MPHMKNNKELKHTGFFTQIQKLFAINFFRADVVLAIFGQFFSDFYKISILAVFRPICCIKVTYI